MERVKTLYILCEYLVQLQWYSRGHSRGINRTIGGIDRGQVLYAHPGDQPRGYVSFPSHASFRSHSRGINRTIGSMARGQTPSAPRGSTPGLRLMAQPFVIPRPQRGISRTIGGIDRGKALYAHLGDQPRGYVSLLCHSSFRSEGSSESMVASPWARHSMRTPGINP